MNSKEELDRLKKKLIIPAILSAPGSILLGWGIYGLFGAKGNAFISILNNMFVVYSFLVIGAVSMLWFILILVLLLKKSIEIENNGST